MTYEPTLDSVKQHQVPAWFDDAKLGIFIHWGLYSVPGWAPMTGELTKVLAESGWQGWFANCSYAEWYLNSLRFEEGPTRAYHNKTYGADFAYDDFVPQFNAALVNWDPSIMAELFQRAGARYVVLTTKHHDGFNMWNTRHPCPRKPNYQLERDVVGDLTEAVRAQGMRMGLYYSGGLDWAFYEEPIRDFPDLFTTIPQEPEFAEYSLAHWYELIDRYQPSVLWSDIGIPMSVDLPELFAHYYNSVPEGVVNNRFTQGIPPQFAPDGDPRIAKEIPHHDFITPEYATLDEIQEVKWETCRGIGHSFGYNRAEGDNELLAKDELIHMFVDIVSKNGNLLLNVGPMADGTIPENQAMRLESLGSWLDVNGEAIFGTRPWDRAEGQTTDGLEVRFTRQGDAVYATLLGTPTSTEVTIKNLCADKDTTVSLLGAAGVLHWQQDGDNLTITLPDSLPDEPAHSLRLLSVRA